MRYVKKTKPCGSMRRKSLYARPQLIKYGEVRSLTKTSSSGPHEGSSGGSAHMSMSDRAVKENIVRIGTHPLGIGLYLFDYRPEYRAAGQRGRQFGVMADEVEGVVPEAVSMHPDGYKLVNYAMLGVKRILH